MTVAGTIGSDAMLAGGTVDVRGPIAGDLRVAGGEVYVTGEIGGDFAGGTVQVRPEASIKGDTVIFGDRVILDGTFEHGVTVRARSVEVHGTVKGPFNATVGESLAIYDNAHLDGGLTYTAQSKANISEKASIQGAPIFNQSKKNSEKGAGAIAASVFSLFGFIGFLNLVVGTTLLAYFFPRFSKQVVDRVLTDSKKTIATGFIVSIILPVGAILFFLTIVGFVFGALFGLGFLVLLALGKALIGVLAGALLAQWRTKEVKVTWSWALWGAVVVYLVGIIPFIGWFVDIILFFAVAGALSHMVYEGWWKKRITPEMTVADEAASPTV
jgi:cytoskeletal protein CcmA (bactofilin family)